MFMVPAHPEEGIRVPGLGIRVVVGSHVCAGTLPRSTLDH